MNNYRGTWWQNNRRCIGHRNLALSGQLKPHFKDTLCWISNIHPQLNEIPYERLSTPIKYGPVWYELIRDNPADVYNNGTSEIYLVDNSPTVSSSGVFNLKRGENESEVSHFFRFLRGLYKWTRSKSS